jgi:glutamate synthase (NADPH) large chain
MRNELQPDHLTVKLAGSAGQSLGAFAARGLKLEVFGDANDYVGKGLSGGTIVVRPRMTSPLVAHENTIIGNTVLYGATAGQLFAAGRAGERFAVRNSGARSWSRAAARTAANT